MKIIKQNLLADIFVTSLRQDLGKWVFIILGFINLFWNELKFKDSKFTKYKAKKKKDALCTKRKFLLLLKDIW